MQGTDYAYTLQGWLKGINSINLLNADDDMGNDGKVAAQNQFIARDAMGFNLDYFLNDFKSINPSVYPFATVQVYLDNLSDTAYRPLYNGNIAGMAVSIKFPNATAMQVPQYYNYKYDQLNRLTQMNVHRGFNASTNSWSGLTPAIADYQERITYDANGNILKYLRNGTAAPNINMDNLTYNYYPNTNRLKYVQDNVADANYADDIDNQTNTSNYSYDAIGNLVTDVKENITLIKWNVYGKITEIQRTSSTANPVTNIQYTYDAAGNRISKRVAKSTTTTLDYTWYVRDASGNVMSTYNGTGTNAVTSAYTLNLTEQHMYGSSRLGILNRNISVKSGFVKPTVVNFTRGNKFFELSNHLGNVLVTVSDKKIPVPDPNNTSQILYYTADVIIANDYFPGGMDMPGRSYSQSNINYRYGFNGKEKDNKDGVVQYDYGFRIYDPRLVRFKSVDPLTNEYAALTPYQFASNNPIEGVDLDGLEYVSSKEVRIEVVRGIVKLKIENMTTVVKNTLTAYNSNRKNWKAGEMGVDFSIGSFNLSKTTPQFPNSDPEPGDADPNKRPDEMQAGNRTSSGTTLPNGTRNDKTVTTASPAGARGFAYLQIAMMAIEKGVSLYIQNREAVDNALINKHVTTLKSAAADVKFALNKTTLIPPEFQTEQYLSDITNIVLSGESYVSKYDEATGAKLKNIGMSIYNTYSVKRKAYTLKIVTQTLGDGVTVNKVEAANNPKYDATYVAENPPLEDPPK